LYRQGGEKGEKGEKGKRGKRGICILLKLPCSPAPGFPLVCHLKEIGLKLEVGVW